jgi:hypothetical protein
MMSSISSGKKTKTFRNIGPLEIINPETDLYGQKVKQIDKASGDVSFHLDLRVWLVDEDDADEDGDGKLTPCKRGLYLSMNEVRTLTKYLQKRNKTEDSKTKEENKTKEVNNKDKKEKTKKRYRSLSDPILEKTKKKTKKSQNNSKDNNVSSSSNSLIDPESVKSEIEDNE